MRNLLSINKTRALIIPGMQIAEMGSELGKTKLMNLLLLVIILLLLFGGGGFYLGGPVYGGSGIGLVLLICLIIFLMGGFSGGGKRL